MIQSTNSHVRRLLSEKTQYEEELKKAKDIMKGRMQGILLQCKYLLLLVYYISAVFSKYFFIIWFLVINWCSKINMPTNLEYSLLLKSI